MKDEVLWLDSIDSAEIIGLITQHTGRSVELVENCASAHNYAQNPDDYSHMIVEPFITYDRDPAQLQETMSCAKQNGLYVVTFTTQHPTTVISEFGLREGVHYDQYISKTVPGATRSLVELLKVHDENPC